MAESELIQERDRIVRVSIVTHRTPHELLECAINCALRSPYLESIDIIDNSPDESLRDFISKFPKVTYLHVENRGYGAAHNISLRKSLSANTQYHLVLNPDVRWEGDVISGMVKFMDTNPDAGLSMPLTFYPSGMLQYTCRLLPTPFDLILRRFLPKSWCKRARRRFLLQDWNHGEVKDVPYLLGSFMFFRTDTLRATGIFDERFFMYPEDIDITRRIHAVSRTLFYPGERIIHDHAAASRHSLKMLHIHIVNICRYFNKWGWWNDPERRRFNRETLQSLRSPD